MLKLLAPKKAIFLIAIAALLAAGVFFARSVRPAAAISGPARVEPVAQASDVVRAGMGRTDMVQAGMASLPLAFEANQGQTDPRVRYMARARRYTLYLTTRDAVFALQATGDVRGDKPSERGTAIHMRLEGGNLHPCIAASGQLPGKTNYFIGRDPSRWHSGVRQYATVSYKDIYPGVDLAFHGEQRQPEFDFVIAPGAQTDAIALRFSGAEKISSSLSGELTLASGAGDLTLHRPIAYQKIDGLRAPVEARFVLDQDQRVRFALGAYDHSRALVIDPSVSYSTYLGGAGTDDGYAIAIDGSGNAYVTGRTKSTDFPVTTGAFSTSLGGASNVFVTKIKADGSALLYSTFVGGNSVDIGTAIVVNAAGNAFVAGETSSTNFPATSGTLQTAYSGGSSDAFVFELNTAGSALTYSTYLGGTGTDLGNGLAVDASGNAIVVGYTESTDFPTHSALQGTIAGASNGFVAKLNSSGKALVYSTFLGGGTNDVANAVAVDSAGNAYVTGSTQNATFPTTTGAFKTSCGDSPGCDGGLTDAFVSVLKPDGSAFVYSTFLGGGGGDEGFGITVDASGAAYVTGDTYSSDFPVSSALQSTFGGSLDAFVTKVNPAGNALLYSTYLGGTGSDTGTGIAVDGTGNAYITGRTASGNFPLAGATQSTIDGIDDAFVSELSANGSTLVFSTYLGGGLGEDTSTTGAGVIGGIAVNGAGTNIYATGNTISDDFPVTNALQTASGGGVDAFVAKFAQPNFTVAATAFDPTSVGAGGSATSSVSLSSQSGFGGTVALTCSVAPASANAPTCGFSPGSITTGNSSTLTASTTASTSLGSYTVTVTGTSSNFVHTTTVTLVVAAPDFSIAAAAFNPASVIAGGSSTSTVSVGSLNSFSGSVALTCAVTPASSNAPTCGMSPASVNPGTPSTLTVSTTTSTPAGTYTATVTGTSGSLTHTATAMLAVTIPDFSIAATALNPASVAPGSSSTSTLTIADLNGFTGSAALTCVVTPAAPNLPTCGLSPASIAAGTPSTLTLSTTAQTTGTFTVTVTGTSGALVHSTPLTLTVTGPDFTIAGSALGAVTQGGSTTSTITIAATNSYTGTVNFTCSVSSVTGGNPLPTCSIPNAVSNGAGTSMLTVSTTGTARAGGFILNLVGSNPGPNGRAGMLFAFWLQVIGLALAGIRLTTKDSGRKKLFGGAVLALTMAALFFLPACSSSGGGGGGCTGCTPTGSYTVKVTGTDSANPALTHSVSPALTLTVN